MISDERLEEIAEEGFLQHGDSKAMAKELLALRKLIKQDDEVLVALRRIDGYEDVAPELVAEDALLSPEVWPEWRVVKFDDE